MRLRSGAEFAPYILKCTLCPPPPPVNPVSTSVDVEPLLQGAVSLEDLRFEQGVDDSEGLGVTSCPPSPLTEGKSEDEADEPLQLQLQPTPGMQSIKKRHRSAGASRHRAKKRVRLASSGHQPHTYAAHPSTTSHHAKELKPLRVSADAECFPASGSESWVVGLGALGSGRHAFFPRDQFVYILHLITFPSSVVTFVLPDTEDVRIRLLSTSHVVANFSH